MGEGKVVSTPTPSAPGRARGSTKPKPRGSTNSNVTFLERRRAPRPRLAEIRRGASLNLLPPSVVAGSVRIIEFLLVAVLGFVIYLAYVEREGTSTHLIYLAAVLIAATANTLTLQALNLYEIPAFSAFVRSFTRIIFAWSFVVGADDGARLLRQGRRRLLARVDCLLVCFGSVDVVRRAARSFPSCQAVDQGGTPQSPRGGRRRRPRGRGADQGARGLARYRYPHRRHLRRPRRPIGCSPIVAGYPKLGNIDQLVDFAAELAARPAHRVAAGHRREAPAPAPQEAVGAAGRHPAVGAQQPAQVPAAHLFLYRQRAVHRHRRQADRRLGSRQEMAVRQDRRLAWR